MIKFPRSFSIFLTITAVFLIMGAISRLTFLLFNPEYFPEAGIMDFLFGLRFDMVSISYGLIPIFLTLLIPMNHNRKAYLKFIKVYASAVVVLFTLFNTIDVIYYRFTLKRTTWDIFHYLSAGDDFASLIPQFLKDYWYIVIVFLLTVFAFILLTNKYLIIKKSNDFNIKRHLLFSCVILALIFIGVRGGLQLRPLNIIDASRYTNAQNAPLLLNTPFSLMKSMGRNQLELKKYFVEEECKKYFNPESSFAEEKDSLQKNIVVIIMESLSKEYMGYFNNGNGYTPFLDSLMQSSTIFTNAYANGKRSIEALPAIFSGLPNLMTEAHGTSIYAGNSLTSLAEIANEHGYETSFYHGGANGTMGFNSYIKLASFDRYMGMDEYPNESDYDGSWGIYDIPYFQYFLDEQSKMKEPFLSSIFSLSAHHPYKLPDEFKSDCPEGKLEIHKMVCYSDIALKKYFKKVKNKDWYERTLFVITADHTAQNLDPKYGSTMGIYSIPIIFFDPSKKEHVEIDKVCQQSDIGPSILNYIRMPYHGIFFGKNAFLDNENGFAMNYINNYYQYIDASYCIYFDGKEVSKVFDYNRDPMLRTDIKTENTPSMQSSIKKMKAVIQEYNRRMIENDLT